MGSTTLAPGDTTNLDISIHMGKGMGGKHVFETTVPSNDPQSTDNKVVTTVNFIE